MNPDTTALALQQHYLQVSALTPEDPTIVVTNAPAQTNAVASLLSAGGLPLSLAIFFILLTLGIITLLITKVHDFNKILTISFLALVTSSIPYGTKLVTETTSLQTKATATEIPQNITVTQVVASGFTVSWQTTDPTFGTVRVRQQAEKTGEQKVFTDPSEAASTTHTINVKNLLPATTYYFEILSQSVWYNHNGLPLEVKTTP
jgi:hypothetical protein